MNVHDLEDAVRQSAVGTAAPARADRRERIRARLAWAARQPWFWPPLLGFVLGMFQVGRPELWRDELRSWSAATRSVSDLVHLLQNTDAAVALYYVMLHAWIQIFGDSATAMRSLSVVAMAGSAAVVALIGRRLFDPRTGLIAGLLFALIPNISRFAQETRPYAVTMLVALLSTLLFLRAIENPVPRRFAVYALSIGVLAYIQELALPLVGVHAVGALLWWGRDRRLLLWSGGAMAVGVLLAVPVVYVSHKQYAHQVGALPPATLSELTKITPRLFASGIVAGAIIAFALLAFTRRQQWRPALFTLAWGIIPTLAIWVASQGADSVWMTRYALASVPGLVLLAAAGIATLRLPMVVAAVLVVAIIGTPDQHNIRKVNSHDVWNYPDPTIEFLDYSGTAKILTERMQPGDGLVYAQRNHFWLDDIGLAYHMQGKTMPPDIFVQQTAVDRGDFWPVECSPLAACLHREPRLWVVSAEWDKDQKDPYRYMEPEKSKLLQENYVITQRFRTQDLGITLTLLTRKS